MTSGDPEILGNADRKPANVLVRVALVAVLVAGAVGVATQVGRHPGTTSGAPRPQPARPSASVASETDFAALHGPRVGRVGIVAVVLSYAPALTADPPVRGTVTTLDGPPGETPLTFSTDNGIPVAVAGNGGVAWIAERTVAPLDGDGPGTLEARDLHAGRRLARLALPQAPNSIAIAGGSVWVGLDGSIVQVDAATHAEQVHATSPGDVVVLVPDAAGQHLYGAISNGARSRVVRWSLPALAVDGEHVLPRGLQPTNVAVGPDGLWVSEADATGRTGRIERLDPTILADASLGALAPTGPGRTVYAGTHEMWLLGLDGSLRCVRLDGNELGPESHVPDVVGRNDPAGLLVAVGDRVYVVTSHGTIAYERSVACPGG